MREGVKVRELRGRGAGERGRERGREGGKEMAEGGERVT